MSYFQIHQKKYHCVDDNGGQARKAKEYEKEGSRGLDIMSETENARALAVEDGYTDRQATKYISFFFAVMKSRDGE